MSRYKVTFIRIFVICIIFVCAAFTRLYGNNWDSGQHLNPDERFLTMVANAMQWPSSLAQYVDTSTSKLNPHNVGFDFYVYGTWPIILVKAVAERLNLGDYANLTLVGRAMSGIVDLITLLFVFFIGKRISFLSRTHSQESKQSHARDYFTGILSMLSYTLMALPIQLSHFFTTDPYMTLFTTISIYLLLFPPALPTAILLGMSVAFAISAKISSLIIFSVIGLYGLNNVILIISQHKQRKLILHKFTQLILFYTVFTIILYLFFRVLMPYFFANSNLVSITLNPKVLTNIKALQSFNNPEIWFPPSVQWINQTKFAFPFLNIMIVGLGLPMGILSMISFFFILFRTKLQHHVLFILTFIAFVFIYQGIQFNFPVRYFWILYPLLAVCIGIFLSSISKKYFSLWLTILVIVLSFWPLSFLSIYVKNHTRITASEWIYRNIPANSVVSFEHWDDPLPLNIPGTTSAIYQYIELPMYAEDNQAKWKEISHKLDSIDYLILSSNRVYGSITSVPKRYPITNVFYQRLFSGSLGFTKIAEFVSRPTLPIPLGLCIELPSFQYGKVDTLAPPVQSRVPQCRFIEFIDDYTDETWTVYDHPKVTIFKKNELYQSPTFY